MEGFRHDYGSTSQSRRNDGDGAVVAALESDPRAHHRSCPNSPLPPLSPLHFRAPPTPPGWVASAGEEEDDGEGAPLLIPPGMRVSWAVIDAGAAGDHPDYVDASPLSHSSSAGGGGGRRSSRRGRRPRSSSGGGGRNGDDDGDGDGSVSGRNSVMIACLAIFACAYVWLTAVAYLSPTDAREPRGSPTGIPVDPPAPPRGTEDAEQERQRQEEGQYRGGGGGNDRGRKFPFIKRQRSVVLRRRGDDVDPHDAAERAGPGRSADPSASTGDVVDATVLVVYGPADATSDQHPHIAAMAAEVARGASSYLSSPSASSSHVGGSVKLLDIGVATFDDVLAADAVIVGSVVYDANVHPDVQAWFDDAWDFSRRDRLKDKVGAAFVTAGGISAGQESATFDLIRDLMVMGLAVVGGGEWEGAFGAQAVVDEGPFGGGGGDDVDDLFLKKAFGLGRRVAGVASTMKLGEAAEAAASTGAAAGRSPTSASTSSSHEE